MSNLHCIVSACLRDMLRFTSAAIIVLMTSASLPQTASAETLRGALASAYASNPQLDAERARARAVDEGVAQAHGAFRPTITGNGSITYQDQKSRPSSSSDGNNTARNLNISITQPIFRGFRSINGVNVAEAQVRAEREILRNTEQVILIGAITAYMDTFRDQAILKLRESNQKVLADTLKSTQDQFRVGEVTRTDVAQAEASLAAAISAIELARANLKTSRATYERFIGHPPSNLTEPKPLGSILPKSIEESVAISSQELPNVIASLYNEQASRFNVDVIRGELLPTLSVEGTVTNTDDPSRSVDKQQSATIVGLLSIPIYEQGIVYSRVRQAKQTQIAALQEIQRAKTEAKNGAVAAWSQHQAARAQMSSDHTAVESNRIALSGVRQEEKVGQRTKLDVLNAEQSYLNAQVNLISTRRNVIVNDYTLLQAIGRLNIQELGNAPEIYDPEEYYFDVRRKWWGLDVTYADGRREHIDTWHTHGATHESIK